MTISAFKLAAELFERVYSSHNGPEPDAFDAATEAVRPVLPAVREEMAEQEI